MLTGTRPFDGPTPEAILWKQRHHDPPAVSDLRSGVPASLERLVTRMLAKDPAARPASAREVHRRLEASAGRGARVRGSVHRPPQAVRRTVSVAAAAAALVALLATSARPDHASETASRGALAGPSVGVIDVERDGSAYPETQTEEKAC